MSWLCKFLVVAGTSLLCLPAPAVHAAIVNGHIDEFEDGGIANWDGGGRNPISPRHIATGGPGGVGDGYLQLASDGAGQAGRLVVFNGFQWGGDYVAAGVATIRIDVNNLGATDLLLRLILEGAGSLTTVAPVLVPARSGWTAVSFSLAPDNLQGAPYDVVMSDVFLLNLLHSPSLVSHRTGAPSVVAQLGVDNITAVPEPDTLVLAALGLVAVLSWAAREGRQRAVRNRPVRPRGTPPTKPMPRICQIRV